ncbi:hypothetical protein C2E21_0815 [Chlorella sorokiniana]|uniref:Uncharacterized protein n=1 Tax=Chlorella sorokiniana TaxID=3076 RepID=A0A2P6U1P9_CHLSO|nr:hypothetical protein C2E21_0815 [Chlorella sorokiniana]|eukprot:PRW60246.1 hypothetical protein C2E21_0815 [Chlorella sorokiniana]
MSRGRVGLIKAIKEIFREVKFFGDAEISTLKKELEAHKLQLEQLKQARQERTRREEALALMEMRSAVEGLQRIQGVLAERDAQMAEQMETLAKAAGARQEQELTERAMRVVQGMDLRGMLTQEEEALQEQLAKFRADLEAAGNPPPRSGGGAAGSGSSSGGGSRGKRRR